ncbi:hypothetical protein CNMCM5623_003546 [Aspergillus felis]|uniref:Ubiquitin conjugating enzyme n=1 Tax=Aspergillus felis TaxID=1287682 RepID=A0A8H6QCC0_9EURO|nr:hypothetical protein CNMCM5623_003546 [Aspergillus felis]
MSSVSSVLIRRGTELISARLRERGQSPMNALLGLSIVVLPVVIFGFAIFWVDYTCVNVIATLAAVEDSNPKTYICLDSEDSNDTFDPNDPEVAAASTTKPITSGLRSATKHLRARGGIWSCFRGFHMYLAFTGFANLGAGLLIQATVVTPDHSVSFSFFSSFFGQFIASMLLATWQMAWIHRVIADKSPRSSSRQMLSLRHWPRIAPAAALYNFLRCAPFCLPIVAAGPAGAGWTPNAVVTDQGYKGFLRFIAIYILPAVLIPLASIPARGIFTRVAASMLPDEDHPIVPFDRHFGGKVKSGIVGGSGKLGLRDAWTSFDRPARTRFVKIILKTLAIEIALGVFGILLIMGEVALYYAFVLFSMSV